MSTTEGGCVAARAAAQTERDETGVTDAEGAAHLHEPFAVQEIYMDGISGVHVAGGMMRALGFSMQPDGRSNSAVAVIRLIMTELTAEHMIAAFQKAFADKGKRRSGGRKKSSP